MRGPLFFLIPMIPSTAAKMMTRSAASKIPKKVYWLKASSALVNAQIVALSMTSPMARIMKPPHPLNTLAIVIIQMDITQRDIIIMSV